MRGLDRVTATRLAFLLGIPALLGAGVYELPAALDGGVGWLPTLVATVVSFAVAYATVAWLLKYVAGHTIRVFVWYRWALAAAIIIALSTGRTGGDLIMTADPAFPVAAEAVADMEPVTQDGKPVDQPRPPVTTVVLVRHGRSTANTAGLLAGRTSGCATG